MGQWADEPYLTSMKNMDKSEINKCLPGKPAHPRYHVGRGGRKTGKGAPARNPWMPYPSAWVEELPDDYEEAASQSQGKGQQRPGQRPTSGPPPPTAKEAEAACRRQESQKHEHQQKKSPKAAHVVVKAKPKLEAPEASMVKDWNNALEGMEDEAEVGRKKRQADEQYEKTFTLDTVLEAQKWAAMKMKQERKEIKKEEEENWAKINALITKAKSVGFLKKQMEDPMEEMEFALRYEEEKLRQEAVPNWVGERNQRYWEYKAKRRRMEDHHREGETQTGQEDKAKGQVKVQWEYGPINTQEMYRGPKKADASTGGDTVLQMPLE